MSLIQKNLLINQENQLVSVHFAEMIDTHAELKIAQLKKDIKSAQFELGLHMIQNEIDAVNQKLANLMSGEYNEMIDVIDKNTYEVHLVFLADELHETTDKKRMAIERQDDAINIAQFNYTCAKNIYEAEL